MEARRSPTSGINSHLNAAPSAVVIPFGRPANKSWADPFPSTAHQAGSSSSAAAEPVPDWWSAEVGEDELVYTTTSFSVGPTRAVGTGKGKGKGKAKGKAKGHAQGGSGAGAAAQPVGGRGAAAGDGRGAAAGGGSGAKASVGKVRKRKERKAKAHRGKGGDAGEEQGYSDGDEVVDTTTP